MKKILLSTTVVAATGLAAIAAFAETAATDLTVQTDAAVAATVPAATLADPTMPARKPVIRDGFAAADMTAITSDLLIGAKAYDANDAWIGEVSELIIDRDSMMTDVVVDVGGFLGIGEKPVALRIADLDILRASAGGEVRVYISMTKEQLEALPTYAR